MTSRIGYFIGMALADFVNLFRGRQAVPCLVDWEEQYPESGYAIRIGPASNQSAPTAAELNDMAEAKGLTAAGFNLVDDCCPDYEVDCCLETDTIGEAQGKA